MKLYGYVSTFIYTMELTGFYLVLTFFYAKQYVGAQSIHQMECIPAMPDFEAIFANTLRLRPEFRAVIEEIKRERFSPPDCAKFDSSAVDNIWELNVQRCTQYSYITFDCITTTTSTSTTTTSTSTSTSTTTTSTTSSTTTSTTTTTTRAPPSTRSTHYVPPGGASSSTPRWSAMPSPPTEPPWTSNESPPWRPPGPQTPPGTPSSTPTPGDQDTTGLYIPGSGSTGVVPTVQAVVHKSANVTTTVISVGAGLLGLLLIIGLLLLCRRKRPCFSTTESWETKSQSSQKRLFAGNGALDAHLKHEKVQRQRSDCQPISATNPSLDTYDPFDPSSPTIHTVYGGYNRGFVTNGRKWRPDGSVHSLGADTISEAGSSKSGASGVPMNGRYVILREDSTSSAFNFNLHYNTLRAIDHPHALMTGGFGESSTDVTLPRNLRLKRKMSGDIAETEFSYNPGIDKSSKNSSRYASRESIISINAGSSDILNSRTSIKSTGSLRKGSHVPNGMVIPVPNPGDCTMPRTHRLYKKNSCSSIGSNSRKNSIDFDRQSQGTIDEADQALDASNLSMNGQGNPAFRDDEDDPVFVETEQPWKSWRASPDMDTNMVDSLVNPKNIDMFSYDNPAMEGSLPRKPRGKGPNGVIPHREQNGELCVAVIEPVNKGKGGTNSSSLHRQNAVDDNDSSLDSRKMNGFARSVNGRTPSKTRRNGSIPVAATPPYSHNPSPTSTANKSRSPSSSVANGKLPHHDDSPKKPVNNKSSFLYGVNDWSHTNGHHKPAAEVNPMPKHADVRL